MCSYTIEKQRCRDRVINDFLSRSRHLLVPFLFRAVASGPAGPVLAGPVFTRVRMQDCACVGGPLPTYRTCSCGSDQHDQHAPHTLLGLP